MEQDNNSMKMQKVQRLGDEMTDPAQLEPDGEPFFLETTGSEPRRGMVPTLTIHSEGSHQGMPQPTASLE
jgi:hypothetical protein